MNDSELDLLRGTLDLLILKALAAGGLHGYALSKWVRAASRQMLNVEDRALYVALHRLEARQLVKGRWQLTDGGRRVKRYELTAAGEERLVADISQWERYVEAMTYVLRTPAPEGT